MPELKDFPFGWNTYINNPVFFSFVEIFFVLLKYSWFTLSCVNQVYSTVNQLNICVCVCVYIYIYIYIWIQTFIKMCQNLFLYRLLQNIECCSLFYTVCVCWLSILYIVVCYMLILSSQFIPFSTPTFPSGSCKLVFYVQLLFLDFWVVS